LIGKGNIDGDIDHRQATIVRNLQLFSWVGKCFSCCIETGLFQFKWKLE